MLLLDHCHTAFSILRRTRTAMVATAHLTGRSWRQLSRWAATACLLFLALGWASAAYAATPEWWDCNYGYRKQITVSTVTAVAVGHSVALTFDHASLVSSGKSLSNGNDVRVLYWNGSSWTEIARGLNPGASWNNSATKIWFKLQAAISSSSSDGNYYLYYGNPSAGSPPSSWGDVFVFYDGFESGNLTAWSGSYAGSGDSIAASTEQKNTGSYSGKAQIDSVDTGGPQAMVWKNIADHTSLHAKMHIYLPTDFALPRDPADPGDRPYVVVMEYVNPNVDGQWVNIIDVTINEDMTLYMWNGTCTAPSGAGTCEAYGFQATNTISKGTWHTLEMMAKVSPTSGEARVWLDGNLEIEATGINLGSNPITRFASGIYWSRPRPNNNPNTVYHDDVVLRGWVSSEPTTSLGTELAQDCPPPTGFSPCNYQYRKQITVTNNDSIQLGTNTIASFTADTQNLIGAGKLRSDGKDWRIVYWNGSAHVEIAQLVKSGWNTSSTQTWFRLQAAINAGANDGNYYVYYGYAGETSNPQTFTATESLLESYNTSDNQGNEALDYDSTEWGAAQGVQFNAGTSRYWEITRFRFYKNQGSGSSSQVAGFVFTATGQGEGNQITNGKSNNYASNTFGSGWNNIEWGGSKPRVKTGTQYYIAILPTNPSGRSASGGWFRWDYDNSGSSYRSTCGNCKAYGIRQDKSWGFYWVNDGADRRFEVYGTEASNSDLSAALGSEETVGTVVSYFTPDAAAAGMNVPVTFVGSVCQVPTVTTSSTDIVVGPVVMTDATGAVVSSLGKVVSTVFFVKPDARPATGITVTVDGKLLNQTFDIVVPAPDPNGGGALSGRTTRGTTVLGGLTVGSGQTLSVNTSDTDGTIPGNQGYLPAVILVKGDVNIAGTVDVKGQDGVNAGADSAGGNGGTGGPGGGGGGGGGVKEGTGGSVTFSRVQSATAVGNPTASATFGSTPTAGNLLVAMSVHRKDMNSASISGTGWTQHVFRTTELTNSSYRRGLSIWAKVAGASEPTNIQATWSGGGSDKTHKLIIQEFSAGAAGATWTFQNKAENDNGTTSNATSISTGTTGSVSDGNLLLITALLVRDTSTAIGSVSWTNSVGSNLQSSGDAGSHPTGASGFGTHTSGGTKSSTASWSGNNSGASAAILVFSATAPGGGGTTAAPGGEGHTGGGGGGSKGAGGSGGPGGTGTGAVGSAASGTTGGAGGSALPGGTGGGGGMANTEVGGGDGGGGGTGSPFGFGGFGANTDGALGGEGGGGGGASGGTPGGGGGGGFATAGGTMNATEGDAGLGGAVNGNAQLVPLAGGSGGGGGGPDVNITSANRGGGGGGGGGAIQIYATGSLTISGTITAAGGNGGNGYTSGGDGSGGGGGGSGGAIFLQSGSVTASGTFTTAGGTAGTSTGNAAGGAGGTGRIRIDGLSSGSSVPGTAGSKFIGPVIDTLVDTTVKGRADGGATVTLYVYDSTGAQVSGSPYTTSASGGSGTVGTWTINNVTFPSGTGYLAVKQTSGSAQVLGPGRATKGLHLINWREVY
jgi:hypothetical protein